MPSLCSKSSLRSSEQNAKASSDSVPFADVIVSTRALTRSLGHHLRVTVNAPGEGNSESDRNDLEKVSEGRLSDPGAVGRVRTGCAGVHAWHVPNL